MTKELIEITFGNAMTQAKELDACADTMEHLAKSSLVQIQRDMSAAWQGENANNYFAKLLQTEENISQTADKIRDIADKLRRVATIFRTSELRALEIAKQRTYES